MSATSDYHSPMTLTDSNDVDEMLDERNDSFFEFGQARRRTSLTIDSEKFFMIGSTRQLG
jgi:hypothetical protein